MIQRTFEDLDGHIWEIICLGPTHVPKWFRRVDGIGG
jgi:hypothetical protein